MESAHALCTHRVSLASELVMSHSHNSSPAIDGAELADCVELSSDMSGIIKQLVFSPEKEEEQQQEQEAVSQVQQEAAAEAVEDAVQQIDEPVAVAVEAVAEAEPVAVEASAEVEPVTSADDASMSAPIAIAAAEPEMEAALEATVPSSPLPVAATVAAVAPADADDADEDVAAFPTFATAVEDEQMSYVSAEMKTQELLLLSARDQSASTSSSRRMSRSGASSGSATPRSSSSVRQAESAARLSAPSYSASKRRAASATPQSRRREVESAVAAVALLRGSVKKPAPQPEKRKLTLASSPKLTTRTRTHSSTLSSEDAELLRMRVERSALKKLQELNAKKLDSVLHCADASDLLPVRSTKSLTQPQELKLRTAGRSKTRTPVVEEVAPVAKKAAHAFVAGQLTQAKPFAFQTVGRARSSSVSASRSAHAASTSVAPSATPSRSASRSTSRAPSRSVSRSMSRASSRAGSRAGSRATSPSRSSAAASSTATPALTQPKEFNFATSKRAKAPTPAAEPTPVKKERASMLSAGGLTQPKPFALLTDMRAPLPATPAASGSSFVSLANQTANWLGSGHDRVVTAPTMGAAGASQLTAPRQFHFHTHERKPSAPVLSSEERAMAEAEAAKLALKAEKEAALKAALAPSHRPLESFRAPSTLTQIQPFHLTEVTPRPREDKAALEAAAVEKEREERRRKVLASSKANGVTVAQAPTLAVLQRVPLKEHAPAAEAPKPVAVTTGPTSLTIPAPFELSTDVRGASKQDAFSAKLAAEAAAAKAAASFHAAPMPAEGAPTFVPQVPHRRVLADLQPNLRSVALHEQSSKQFAAQLAAEKALDREQRTFVAKPLPATILSQPAFVPKPPAKQLTAPEEPTFNSDQRAERRAQLEREQAVRQAAADKMRQEAEAVRRKEEAEEMKRFRASLVIHAKPVPLSSQAPR